MKFQMLINAGIAKINLNFRSRSHTLVIYFIIPHIYEPPRGKTNNVVSHQVRHKLACTSTEKSYKLEISDLSRRGIVLSELRKQRR